MRNKGNVDANSIAQINQIWIVVCLLKLKVCLSCILFYFQNTKRKGEIDYEGM